MKYIIRLLSFLLAVLLLVLPLGGCAYKRRPLAYLKSSLERTLKQSVAGEAISLLFESLDGGSLALSLRGENTLGGASALDATLYFNEEDAKIMSDTVLSVGEKRYDAQLWFSREDAVLTSTAFLGSTTLGASFETLKEDIAHSIFRNNSGTAYAVPAINESSAAAMLAWVDGFYTLFGSLEEMPDLFDKYVDVFLKYLTQYANYTRYTESGRVKIYLLVDNSMLSRALRDTWAKAVKDKSFTRRVRELAKTRDAMQSAIDGVVSTAWSDKVEAWLRSDIELETLCAELDAATPFTFELNATVKKLTGKLLYVDFTHKVGDKSTAFSLDLLREDALEVSLLLNGVKRSLAVHTGESTWRTEVADFTYHTDRGEDALEVLAGEFRLDKKSDTFTLTFGKDGVSKTVEGSFWCKSDALSLSVDRVKTGQSETDFHFSLSVKEKAEMPAAPQYVNLPTVTEQRIDPVAKRAREAYTAFLAELDQSAFTWQGVLAYLLAPFSFEN